MYNFMFSIKWYILGILKPIQVVLQFLDSYHKEHQEHRNNSFWYFDLSNNEKVVLRQLMDEEREVKMARFSLKWNTGKSLMTLTVAVNGQRHQAGRSRIVRWTSHHTHARPGRATLLSPRHQTHFIIGLALWHAVKLYLSTSWCW